MAFSDKSRQLPPPASAHSEFLLSLVAICPSSLLLPFLNAGALSSVSSGCAGWRVIGTEANMPCHSQRLCKPYPKLLRNVWLSLTGRSCGSSPAGISQPIHPWAYCSGSASLVWSGSVQRSQNTARPRRSEAHRAFSASGTLEHDAARFVPPLRQYGRSGARAPSIYLGREPDALLLFRTAQRTQRLDRDDSRDPASYWDPGVSLALASSRRAERNTATSLDVKPIGWARAGSAEGRRTGRGLRRMPGEGGRSVWLGWVCLASDWNRAISISGVRGARCRITATSPAERGDVGADRRVAVCQGRAYTTIHGGRWCSCGPIPRGDRIRGEAGRRPAGWELGCIARASAVEGRTCSKTKPPVDHEDDHMRRWKGRLVFRNRPGHSNAAGGRDLLCFFSSSLLSGEGARDMGPLREHTRYARGLWRRDEVGRGQKTSWGVVTAVPSACETESFRAEHVTILLEATSETVERNQSASGASKMHGVHAMSIQTEFRRTTLIRNRLGIKHDAPPSTAGVESADRGLDLHRRRPALSGGGFAPSVVEAQQRKNPVGSGVFETAGTPLAVMRGGNTTLRGVFAVVTRTPAANATFFGMVTEDIRAPSDIPWACGAFESCRQGDAEGRRIHEAQLREAQLREAPSGVRRARDVTRRPQQRRLEEDRDRELEELLIKALVDLPGHGGKSEDTRRGHGGAGYQGEGTVDELAVGKFNFVTGTWIHFATPVACRANHSPSSPFPDALEGRVAGLDERASFGPGRRPRLRNSPSAFCRLQLLLPAATCAPGALISGTRCSRRVSRQSRPSSPSPTRTGYVDWLDERASVGLAPVRVPASGLARGLLASLAGDDTPRVAGLGSFGLALGRRSSPPDSPSSFVSAPSPGGDVCPGRVDQRHSLLTSSATPTTVRPPPFPDALAARGEVNWLLLCVRPGRMVLAGMMRHELNHTTWSPFPGPL
ncbi:hypothetical protein THAOC_09576 [Thalassiosira oceanica]|uniref:Uncharacterized protein n=1 Tax=Thalassiosira oceanica TaxID=159749 RepID=K0T7F0_THAOC|nr:hypothetical protein THAOC_09576 [Thalassiosira oceanica]|eukprot:EJK69201.1 hypothetical protein THAOC_09576 [Thalassiosira oceanica]